ncbi:YcbK family protein [Verrucomicrobiota bacterium sgz303538]
MTALEKELETFINDASLRYFKGRELTAYWRRTRGNVRNSVPPRELWPNILPALRVLNEFRRRHGAPVFLTSTYRSDAYNKAIGGERASCHTRFLAIDFTCKKGTPVQWARLLKEIRDTEKRFKGGIGVYPTRNFVHLDTRGYVANWRG